MKTVLDAVNTLKGVWPSDAIQIIEIDGVEFSEKEFNDCVVGCINDFGLPSVTAKPVYWDGKEGLKVGMIVLADGRKGVILLPDDNDGDYVIMNDNGNYGFCRIHQIKPIDKRTPKEKAIDDLMDEQASLIGNIAYMKKSFGIAYDKWVK